MAWRTVARSPSGTDSVLVHDREQREDDEDEGEEKGKRPAHRLSTSSGAGLGESAPLVDAFDRGEEFATAIREGVAAGSLHLKGQAIDIRLGDVPLDRLRRSALALRAGGVGYYPASNFVHVDTGRVRFW